MLFTWDHFFPLYGPRGRRALRVLDDARRVGRGHRAGRDRRARHVQQLPQPAAARRHGAHRRPHQRRPAHPRHRVGLVRARLRRVRLRVRHGRAAGSTPSTATCRSSRSAGAGSTPPPTRDIPVLIGGGGERKTLRIVAEQADIWHGFGAPETIAHKHAVLDEWCAQDRARPGRDRAVGRRLAPARPPPRGRRRLRGGRRGARTPSAPGCSRSGCRGPRYDLGPVRDLVAWRDARARLACEGAPRAARASRRRPCRTPPRAPSSSPSTAPTAPA